MNRNLPQPGEKWKQAEGEEYWIVAIAEDDLSEKVVVYASERIPYLPTVAKHTEIEELVFVQEEDGKAKTYYFPGMHYEEGSERWARPLASFMEILSSGEGEEASNYPRFELVE